MRRGTVTSKEGEQNMFKQLAKIVRRLLLLSTILVILFLLISLTPYPWRLLYPLSYRDIVLAEAERAKLDPSLVAAMINVESRWRADAISPKNATGLMQLLPTTATWIAEKMEIGPLSEQDLFSPDINIRLGVSYFADLLTQFEANETVAIAAYNGGRGNVEKWLTSGLWDGSEAEVDSIPFGETRRYVLKVKAQRKIYKRIYNWAPRDD